MTEQPTSASAKCPKCFSPAGAPHGDHYTTCPDYRHPSGAIAGTLAGFYASPEYRAAVLTGELPEQATFTAGQRVHWTGTSGQFDRIVTIERSYNSYLMILGEGPEDGRLVYDIQDSVIGGTVYAIPANQLHA